MTEVRYLREEVAMRKTQVKEELLKIRFEEVYERFWKGKISIAVPIQIEKQIANPIMTLLLLINACEC